MAMQPVLQLALDHENLARALKVAKEAVAGARIGWRPARR